jgi:hypothetical protein
MHNDGSWCVCGCTSLSHGNRGNRPCLTKDCLCCRFRYDTDRKDQPVVEEKTVVSELNHKDKKLGRPRNHWPLPGEKRRALLRKYGVNR